MANELQVTISSNFNLSGAQHNFSISDSLTVTSVPFHDKIYAVGTAEEEVTFGDVTPGLIILQNTDNTNFVQFGRTTGVYTGRMKAGEPACFRLDDTSTSIFLKSNTASCFVRVIAYGRS